MKNDEAIQTQRFLTLVSRRLSARDDCARSEYLVGIGRSIEGQQIVIGDRFNDQRYITMVPDKYVYPDTQHRKETDRSNIIDYIIKKYYPELIIGQDEYGRVQYDTSRFTLGVYRYQISSNFKRRRWVRISD